MLKENTKKAQKTRGGLNQANLKLGMKSIHTVDVSSSINNYNSNKFTLPRIEDILDNVGRTKFYSVLDLNSGFRCIYELLQKVYPNFVELSVYKQFDQKESKLQMDGIKSGNL